MTGDRERVWPLFGVLADVKSVLNQGLWVGGGPIIHYHYEVLFGFVLD